VVYHLGVFAHRYGAEVGAGLNVQYAGHVLCRVYIIVEYCVQRYTFSFKQAQTSIIFYLIRKKVPKNFASSKKLRTFAPAKRKTLHP
jgi:hypothetical protein